MTGTKVFHVQGDIQKISVKEISNGELTAIDEGYIIFERDERLAEIEYARLQRKLASGPDKMAWANKIYQLKGEYRSQRSTKKLTWTQINEARQQEQSPKE